MSDTIDEVDDLIEAERQRREISDQPAPQPNNAPAVWAFVIDDMRERDRVGRERYGTPLQPFNGRRSLVDAYQEALDLVVYLRQRILEDQIERTRRLLPEEAELIEAGKALGMATGRELAMGYHTAIDWRPNAGAAARWNEALDAYQKRVGELVGASIAATKAGG
jgi:hypothetical protein